MSWPGALGTAGLGREISWGGSGVAPTVFFPFTSESFKETIEPIMETQIRGILDESPQYKGMLMVAGGISGMVYPSQIGHLLRAVLGAPTQSGTGPFTHTFNPAQGRFSADAPLPPYSWTIERNGQRKRYVGCVCSSLSFSFTQGGALTFDSQWIGFDATDPTAPTVTLPTDSPFVLTAAIQRASVAFAEMSEFSCAINNNIEGVKLINNTDKISRIAWNGFRSIEFSGQADFGSIQLYNDFKAYDLREWRGTWTNGANSLALILPAGLIADAAGNVGGDGRISLSFSGKGKYDTVTGRSFQAILTNSVANYNTA